MDASIPLLEKYPLPVSGLTSERNFSLSHLQGGQAGNRCLSSLHFRRSAIKTINLRYCYLYYTGNMFVEVSDEVAEALLLMRRKEPGRPKRR